MDCNTAKQIDLVDYLSSLGFTPAKIEGNNYTYLTPLGTERTPSFHINRNKNIFKCWSTGAGGTIIDFVCELFKCNISSALKHIEEKRPFIKITQSPEKKIIEKDNGIKIVSVDSSVTSPYLINYIVSRAIDVSLGLKYFNQVRYENNGKQYWALGFKNSLGGFELRSPHFKGASKPKGVTIIKNGSQTLKITEGVFSFLSLLKLQANEPPTDYLILNSLTMIKNALPLMLSYDKNLLYLDRDDSGQKRTLDLTVNPHDGSKEGKEGVKSILEAHEYQKFKDESTLYQGYKDANEFLKDIAYKKSSLSKDNGMSI